MPRPLPAHLASATLLWLSSRAALARLRSGLPPSNASGSPGGQAGFNYLGDTSPEYKRLYEMTSKEDPKAWADLINVFKVLNTTPPDKLEAAITSRTKAIIPVHLYGMPAEMDRIMAIAERHGLPVIEDAAQAHGARYRGRRVGQFGQIACFSFYPSKNLGAYGEGGALITNDASIARRARSLRDHAQSQRYLHDEIGYNYRMDSFQGAVLSIKLKHLDEWNTARIDRARYLSYVRDIAQKWLDWKTLGPAAQKYHDLIAADVTADTRKLFDNAGFEKGVESVKEFADARREYLLKATPAK